MFLPEYREPHKSSDWIVEMFFLIFSVPIGLVAAYMTFVCARQKHTSAALLMGGVTAACLIVSLLIVAAGMFVAKVT